MSKELNEKYRQELRVIKANTRISFKQMKEYLGLRTSGFYHWINAYYDLSEEKLEQVAQMIEVLKQKGAINMTIATTISIIFIAYSVSSTIREVNSKKGVK